MYESGDGVQTVHAEHGQAVPITPGTRALNTSSGVIHLGVSTAAPSLVSPKLRGQMAAAASPAVTVNPPVGALTPGDQESGAWSPSCGVIGADAPAT